LNKVGNDEQPVTWSVKMAEYIPFWLALMVGLFRVELSGNVHVKPDE
jgi:hypothetical protein